MAQNVFDASLERNNRLDRNPFDWSHVWNGTTKHGTITPVFCELVPQKHSIRINPEFGLEMMPMVFPVQTRQFARLNFFKVPLRALWEEYTDFISNFREDLEEPYLLPDEQAFKKAFLTGTLGDYLNIPTRGMRSSTSTPLFVFPAEFLDSICTEGKSYGLVYNNVLPDLFNEILETMTFQNILSDCPSISSDRKIYSWNIGPNITSTIFLHGFRITIASIDYIPDVISYKFKLENYENGIAPFEASSILMNGDGKVPHAPAYLNPDVQAFVRHESGTYYMEFIIKISPENKALLEKNRGDYLSVIIGTDFRRTSSGKTFSLNIQNHTVNVSSNIFTDEETSYQTTPFATKSNPDNLRLLAYKFRAYEAVYNAFYRDVRNDPFIVDGRPVYNKWLPTMKGGADSTPYELHQCNWERDMFTTCIPSPQQGRAPLAGLTVYDAITTNEDGSYTVQKATALVTEDGAKYGITYNVSEDGQTLETVDYEPLSDKTEVVPIRSTLDLVNSGLSIETLRMTNAYQKYLELNMRKSFTYKAIMEGRYDVNLRFDELLMPEFIGGVSREMSMNVSEQSVDQQNTADNGLYKDALGSKAGIAGVYGKGNGNIECFCDEESIVIGLLTITPVPIYTQMLPKDYTYRSILDHWAPEFSNIGYQPVTYKEMCPLNVAGQSDISKLEDTFGYQRPWYEHVAKYDTAHGLFRSNMNGFLMTRFFSGFPELGGAFLKVDPNVVNQVFSVTEFTDKIFGYVKFNCVVQSPIPRVAIPRID